MTVKISAVFHQPRCPHAHVGPFEVEMGTKAVEAYGTTYVREGAVWLDGHHYVLFVPLVAVNIEAELHKNLPPTSEPTIIDWGAVARAGI